MTEHTRLKSLNALTHSPASATGSPHPGLTAATARALARLLTHTHTHTPDVGDPLQILVNMQFITHTPDADWRPAAASLFHSVATSERLSQQMIPESLVGGRLHSFSDERRLF